MNRGVINLRATYLLPRVNIYSSIVIPDKDLIKKASWSVIRVVKGGNKVNKGNILLVITLASLIVHCTYCDSVLAALLRPVTIFT